MSDMTNDELEIKLNHRCNKMYTSLNGEGNTTTEQSTTGFDRRDRKTRVFLARVYILTAFRDVASKIAKAKYKEIGASIQEHAKIIVKILSPNLPKEGCENLTSKLTKLGQALLKLLNTYQVISSVVGSEVNLTWAGEILNHFMRFDFKAAAELTAASITTKPYTPKSYREWVKLRRPLAAYIQHTTSDIFDPQSDVYWSNANLEQDDKIP